MEPFSKRGQVCLLALRELKKNLHKTTNVFFLNYVYIIICLKTKDLIKGPDSGNQLPLGNPIRCDYFCL